MAISLHDLKLFFSKQAKHGSIILAVIIPIVIVLSELDLIGKDFLKAITQFIAIIGVGIVVFRISLDEYERAKIKNIDINAEIAAGDLTKAKNLISDNLGDLTKVSVDIAKDVITTIKKPKEIIIHETSTLEETLSNKSTETTETPKKPSFAII